METWQNIYQVLFEVNLLHLILFLTVLQFRGGYIMCWRLYPPLLDQKGTGGK